MITKKTLTRQSIDELVKVCPGVTVPERAMSTIYGCGNGSANNPFTWDEYQAFLARDYASSTPYSGVIYYYRSGVLEAVTFIGSVDVTGNRPFDPYKFHNPNFRPTGDASLDAMYLGGYNTGFENGLHNRYIMQAIQIFTGSMAANEHDGGYYYILGLQKGYSDGKSAREAMAK